MKVYCVFSLESPHRGDSNVYTQYTIFIIKKIITPDYSKSADMGFFFLGTQERVRNSRGKRAYLKFYCILVVPSNEFRGGHAVGINRIVTSRTEFFEVLTTIRYHQQNFDI